MENSRFISFNNSTVFYRVFGNGKTVVLLHGFGEDGNIWTGLADKLKSNFQVIVPDIPGSGKSPKINNGNTEISVDNYAEAVMHVLEKENVLPCTIIGHSMGGYIVLAIAEKYPGALSGLGLFHSTAFADSEEKRKGRLKAIEFMKENDGITFLKKSVPDLFTERFRREHPGVIEKLLNSVKYFSSESLIQYSRAMLHRPDRTKVLQNSAVPVLFIIGEKDPAITLQQSLTQCYMPSLACMHLLPEAGHMGMLEEPGLCAGLITAYLKDIESFS